MRGATRLRINEIFHSIQGEGSHVGVRCAFVRLTGCHLRCSYCDTEYSFHEGTWMTVDAILEQIAAFACPAAEVTGGEPLLQPGVYDLLDALLERYSVVMLETSGALSIARVDARVVRIVDLKTPSSGESGRNCWENVDLLTVRDEVKFVIGTREDYEWSREILARYNLSRRCAVLMSPVVGTSDPGPFVLYKGNVVPRQLAEWILEDRLDVRFGIQLHKQIWPAALRGV